MKSLKEFLGLALKIKNSFYNDDKKLEKEISKICKCKCKRYYDLGIKTNYFVSKNGDVFSYKENTHTFYKMIPNNQKSGYQQIHLTINGKSYYRWLHRMIALTFIKNRKNKPEVNHKDGDKSNNKKSNLEWTTSKENIQHAFKHKLRKNGEESSHAKMTNEQAHMICKLLEENSMTMNEIAQKVGVPYHFVFQIYKGNFWVDISKKYNFKKFSKFESSLPKLTKEDAENICKELINKNFTIIELSQKYNVTPSTIYAIKNKKRYKEICNKYF